MDTIVIKALHAEAIIGVYVHEKTKKQPIVMNLELQVDLRAAGQSDQLDDTVDYALVANGVVALVQASRFELLEALGETICQYVLTQFAVQKIVLDLVKPLAVPHAESVGIHMVRLAEFS